MSSQRTPIGPRLQEARRAAGLTQLQLAEQIGATGRAVQFWEYGQRMPRVEYLKRIAEVTDRPLSWFFEEVAA